MYSSKIQIGKFLPGSKVVMVAAHIAVEHPVGTGDLQAQYGAVQFLTQMMPLVQTCCLQMALV